MVHACPEIACVAFPLPERALFRTVLAGPRVPGGPFRRSEFEVIGMPRMVRDVRIDDNCRKS